MTANAERAYNIAREQPAATGAASLSGLDPLPGPGRREALVILGALAMHPAFPAASCLREIIDHLLAKPSISPRDRTELEEAKAVLDGPSAFTTVDVCRPMKTKAGFYAFESIYHAFVNLAESRRASVAEGISLDLDHRKSPELLELLEQQEEQSRFAALEAIADYVKLIAVPANSPTITVRHDPATVPEPTVLTLRMHGGDR